MALQLALGCRTVGYNQQHRRCCTCTDNNTARLILLERYGLSTISASGGPAVSTTTGDYRMLTCAPHLPNGTTYAPYPVFDFSGSMSDSIASSPAGVLAIACPPVNPFRVISLGALESACVATNMNARGFATRLGSGCPSSAGPNDFDFFASFNGNVVFSCVAGAPSYRLGVGVSFLMFIDNPTSYFAEPPATGSDWTRTGTGFFGTFSRNGNTVAEGAAISLQFVQWLPSGFIYQVSASAWVSNPATSVSLWSPADVVDWSGLTTSGTASLA